MISFIICHRESEDCSKTVESVEISCHQAKIKFEIILVSGNCPSYQRNKAVEQTIYPWIYFLDNDSLVKQESIEIANQYILQNKNLAIVGGPSLLPMPNNNWQISVNSVLSHPWIVGKISSRYFSNGEIRETDESELILCNMIINKEWFNRLKGFDSSLYPNEENEFITRLKKQNDSVYYCPEMIVYRNHRKNLKEFIQQMLNYGRGRAEQIKISLSHLRLSSLVSLLFPVIFIVLLFSLLFENFEIFKESQFSYLKFLLFKINDSFFIFYFVAIFLFFSKSCKKHKSFLFYIPVIIFCCHFFYGVGIWKNLFKRGSKADKLKKWFITVRRKRYTGN